MEIQLKTEILKALDCAASADVDLSEKAEKYLLKDSITNLEYFKILMTVSIEDNTEDKLRISSLIILKKILINDWRNLQVQIQELISNSFLDVILNAKSIRCLNLMSEILYKIILFRNHNIENEEEPKESWPEFEVMLLKRIHLNVNNFDNLYRCLIAYHMLAKTREHCSSKEKPIVTKSVANIFPILENLIGSLVNAELNEKNIEFMKIICKIFFKCYRYGVDQYIANGPKIELWMNFFFCILSNDNVLLYKPKKWILRIFLPFLRNFCETESETQFKEFGDFFRETYFEKIFVLFISILQNYQRNMKQEKMIFNISRCFYHIIKLTSYFNKFKIQLFELFKNNLINLIRFTEEDYEIYVNDPIEYFKKNDEYCFDHTIRDSVMNVTASFATDDLLSLMINYFISELNNQTDIIAREAVYFIIHKLADKIKKCEDENFVENLIKNFVIQDINSKEGFMRTRCCILLSRFSQHIFDEDVLKVVVSQICQKLKDTDFPVRSYAAITLDRLLLNPVVVELVRPEIQTLLVIYVNLIHECDNESLINSLTGIFETFNQELAPFVKELLSKMVTLIISLYDKKELNTNEKIEENEFSIISAFQSMHELMKAPFGESDIENIYFILEKLFVKIISENDTELIEELLKLFNLLVFRSPNNNLLPQLWNYFEFFCYILNSKELPEDYQFKNPLLKFANQSKGGYSEMQGIIITIFRNFFYKQNSIIISKSDEFGRLYINLLFQTLKDLKDVESGYEDECNKSQIMVFDANLVLDLLTVPGFNDASVLLQEKTDEMLSFYINYSEKILKENKKELIDINIVYHNLGIFLWQRFAEVFTFINSKHQNLCQTLFLNWTKEHKAFLTHRIRKASFLGLLSLVKNIDHIEFIKNEKKPLLEFLLNDLIFLDIQAKIELENSENDFGLDDLDDEDVQDDMVLDTLENITLFLKQNDNLNPLETEILLNSDFDFCLESFQKINTVEIFKIAIGEMGIDLNTLNLLLMNFPEELKTRIYEILGLKENSN